MLTIGKNAPAEVNVLVEIPAKSSIKYEVDEKTGLIFVDRFAYTAMFYPFNYGYIAETKGEDGDPLDILVISTYAVHPGIILPSRPIGVLEMADEEGIDHKIIAVPTKKIDPFYSQINDISDLATALKDQIKHFFEHYKEIEPGKWVKIKQWQRRGEAIRIIKRSIVKMDDK